MSKEMYDELHDRIVSNIFNFELSSGDILGYGVITDIVLDICVFIYQVEYPQFQSYVSFSASFNSKLYKETGLKICTKINYTYSATKEVITSQWQYISNTVDDILSEIKYAPTDLDKVLYIYDYFKSNNYTYSTTTFNNLYNFLQTKTQHQNGYYMLLNYIFNKIGVQYVTVFDGSTYVCEIVKINRNWYLVDIGKDIVDNTNDYILKSDGYFIEKGRSASYTRYRAVATTWQMPWEETISCHDTKFDWFTG